MGTSTPGQNDERMEGAQDLQLTTISRSDKQCSYLLNHATETVADFINIWLSGLGAM